MYWYDMFYTKVYAMTLAVCSYGLGHESECVCQQLFLVCTISSLNAFRFRDPHLLIQIHTGKDLQNKMQCFCITDLHLLFFRMDFCQHCHI